MEIELRCIHDANSNEYKQMEGLLTTAFPKDEYRELAEMRTLTEHSFKFHNNLIYDEGTFIGLITYWDFGNFFYIEHFAIVPEMRNRGYGKKVMEKLKDLLCHPIVLEVECPTEEMSRRRIGFYERQGFKLWKSEYMQPPYRQGDGFLKLLIMAYGNIQEGRDFENVKRTIHKEVYNYEPKPTV